MSVLYRSSKKYVIPVPVPLSNCARECRGGLLAPAALNFSKPKIDQARYRHIPGVLPKKLRWFQVAKTTYLIVEYLNGLD